MSFYGTVTAYQAYHNERGSVLGTHGTISIQQALVVASEWIDSRYRSLFGGLKVGLRDQVREWPRTGALDYYGYPVLETFVPVEIEQATYEIALIHLAGTTPLSQNFVPAKYRKVSVDGAISLEYAQFANASDTQAQFKRVEEILSGLIGSQLTGDLSNLSGRAVR